MHKSDMKLMTTITKWCLVFILGFALGLVSQFSKADTEMSVGSGSHSTPEVSVAHTFKEESFKVMVSYWNYDSSTVVLSGMFRPINLGLASSIGLQPFRLYIGGAWISNTGRVNGTNLNFIVRPEINITNRLGVYYTHYSNGRKFGIGPEDKPNKGWNFVGIKYIF